LAFGLAFVLALAFAFFRTTLGFAARDTLFFRRFGAATFSFALRFVLAEPLERFAFLREVAIQHLVNPIDGSGQ
jgi:pyruvate carboxylase